MKDRTIYALLALLILAGGSFFFFRQKWEKDEKAKEEALKLFPFEQEKVRVVSLKNPKGTFQLVKEEDRWSITQPRQLAADQDQSTSLVRQLTDLKSIRSYENVSEEDLKQYGLAEPEYLVSLSTESATRQMKIGKDTPVGNNLYAMVDADSKVLVISKYIRTNLDKSLFDLRDKSIFSFESENAIRIAHQTVDSATAASKDEQGVWRMENPKGIRADSNTISSLLSQLKYATVKAFVEEATATPEYCGLVEPATRVIVSITAEAQPEVLLFGHDAADPARLYAMKEGHSTIYELDKSLANSVSEKFARLEDRKLASLNTWSLESVKLRAGETVILSATRSETDRDWYMHHPQEGKMGIYQMSNYLSELTSMEIEQFITEPGPLSQYRMDPPDWIITIGSKEKEESLRISVVPPSATDEQSAEVVYAMRPGENTVFTVKKKMASLLHQDFVRMLEPPEEVTDATAELTDSTPELATE